MRLLQVKKFPFDWTLPKWHLSNRWEGGGAALLHRSAVGEVGPIGIGGRLCPDPRLTMPFKANAARRHHIPKQKRKVTNWAAYDASLRQRASLTIWFSDDAIAGWKAEPRTTRGARLGIRRWRSSRPLIGSIIRLGARPDHLHLPDGLSGVRCSSPLASGERAAAS